jgi:hypothetical protein
MKKPLHLIIGSAAGITGCAIIGALSRAEMALHLLDHSNIEIVQSPQIATHNAFEKKRSIGPTIIEKAKEIVIPIVAYERFNFNTSIRPSHRLDNSSFITGKKSYKNKRR